MTTHNRNAIRDVTINFRLPSQIRDDLDRWAASEDRKRSDMARILLDEALDARGHPPEDQVPAQE